MLCCFCSLLCDREELQYECKIRKTALQELHSIARVRESSSEEFRSEPGFCVKTLRQRFSKINGLLLTGRVYSVETARSVLSLARILDASVDFSEQGWTMNHAIALSRNGAFTSSIAEARATSETFIVVDDGSLLDRFPRIPNLLSKANAGNDDSRTVLLMGNASDTSKAFWKHAFPNTWSIPCSIEQLPLSLLQWTAHRTNEAVTDDEVDAPWLDSLQKSTYITVIWSPACLSCSQPDLWIEELMHWIANQNETIRASSLALAGLDATFQQVCTWTTGYPGRLRFRQGRSIFEMECDLNAWISRNLTNPDACIICVDESANSQPFLPSGLSSSFAGTIVEIQGTDFSSNLECTRVRLPTSIAGYETDATFSRCDQVVMARVCKQSQSGEGILTPTQWLERLAP